MATIAPRRPAPTTFWKSSLDEAAVAELAAFGEEAQKLRLILRKTMQRWFDRSLYLPQLWEESSDDELPAVLSFPRLRTIRTRFRQAGEHEPLPFPDSDD